MNELVYRNDIYKDVKKTLDEFAYYSKIPNGLYGKILRAIENTQSTFWHPCTISENLPPVNEEVLVSLEHRNGKKEIAFGSYWGDNQDPAIAYWGGMNETIRAWAKMPEPYGEDNNDH